LFWFTICSCSIPYHTTISVCYVFVLPFYVLTYRTPFIWRLWWFAFCSAVSVPVCCCTLAIHSTSFATIPTYVSDSSTRWYTGISISFCSIWFRFWSLPFRWPTSPPPPPFVRLPLRYHFLITNYSSWYILLFCGCWFHIPSYISHSYHTLFISLYIIYHWCSFVDVHISLFDSTWSEHSPFYHRLPTHLEWCIPFSEFGCSLIYRYHFTTDFIVRSILWPFCPICYHSIRFFIWLLFFVPFYRFRFCSTVTTVFSHYRSHVVYYHFGCSLFIRSTSTYLIPFWWSITIHSSIHDSYSVCYHSIHSILFFLFHLFCSPHHTPIRFSFTFTLRVDYHFVHFYVCLFTYLPPLPTDSILFPTWFHFVHATILPCHSLTVTLPFKTRSAALLPRFHCISGVVYLHRLFYIITTVTFYHHLRCLPFTIPPMPFLPFHSFYTPTVSFLPAFTVTDTVSLPFCCSTILEYLPAILPLLDLPLCKFWSQIPGVNSLLLLQVTTCHHLSVPDHHHHRWAPGPGPAYLPLGGLPAVVPPPVSHWGHRPDLPFCHNLLPPLPACTILGLHRSAPGPFTWVTPATRCISPPATTTVGRADTQIVHTPDLPAWVYLQTCSDLPEIRYHSTTGFCYISHLFCSHFIPPFVILFLPTTTTISRSCSGYLPPFVVREFCSFWIPPIFILYVLLSPLPFVSFVRSDAILATAFIPLLPPPHHHRFCSATYVNCSDYHFLEFSVVSFREDFLEEHFFCSIFTTIWCCSTILHSPPTLEPFHFALPTHRCPQAFYRSTTTRCSFTPFPFISVIHVTDHLLRTYIRFVCSSTTYRVLSFPFLPITNTPCHSTFTLPCWPFYHCSFFLHLIRYLILFLHSLQSHHNHFILIACHTFHLHLFISYVSILLSRPPFRHFILRLISDPYLHFIHSPYGIIRLFNWRYVSFIFIHHFVVWHFPICSIDSWSILPGTFPTILQFLQLRYHISTTVPLLIPCSCHSSFLRYHLPVPYVISLTGISIHHTLSGT